MIQVKCTKIIKDTEGNIRALIIVDINGNEKRVTEGELANAVKAGKINVINLKLKTKADTHTANDLGLSEEEINNRLLKQGLDIQFNTSCGHKCTLRYEGNKTIINVPDDVVSLKNLFSADENEVPNYRHKFIKGNVLEVVGGGPKLKDLTSAFSWIKNKNLTIDMHKLDCSNVTKFNLMCSWDDVYKIIVPANKKKVSKFIEVDVYRMFFCNAKVIDLNGFDISRIKSTEDMFEGCKAKEVNMFVSNIGRWDKQYFGGTFNNAEIGTLRIFRNILEKIYKTTDGEYFLSSCNKIGDIELYSFKTEVFVGGFSKLTKLMTPVSSNEYSSGFRLVDRVRYFELTPKSGVGLVDRISPEYFDIQEVAYGY